ncbi:MAG: class I SAM-dependent rRNA methyltransferase [Deltaproteobacteria bacterium]|nr:class I SAM-dependent rRNA methyltransferase [Deltaproteobacteria bacterium]
MAAAATPMVKVGARGRARIAAGQVWIYRQDVAAGPETDARSGGPTLVLVTDERRKPLAVATWAAHSPVALRILHPPRPARWGGGWGKTLPDLAQIVADRLAGALAFRRRLALDRDAFRAVHGESDGLPGLFLDVYADAAVLQTATVAMDAHKGEIAKIAAAQLASRLIVSRDDGSARDFEGLPRTTGLLLGSGSSMVEYRLGPNRFVADLLADGKTGGFLDQADNHALVAALVPKGARCLDAFAYHGGFALALARKGARVLATDENAQAVERTRANAARNSLANLEVRQANAFDLLRSLEASGETFDVVVLDPPAFAKRRSGDLAAARAYREIVLRGLRLAAPGGLVVACSCSGRVSREQFDAIVAAAAADSGRQVQILARLGAGRDHPELAGLPETGHLKCWILRAIA